MLSALFLPLAALLSFPRGTPGGLPSAEGLPDRIEAYYSGPPCPASPVDRTFGQFLVNLAPEEGMLRGVLVAGEHGQALLARDGQPPVRLVSNASRADWLLAYPTIGDDTGVWGHPILRPDCSTDATTFYVDAIFPPGLIQGRIDPRFDLRDLPDTESLQKSIWKYRRALARGMADEKVAEEPGHGKLHAAGRLAEALFEPGPSMAVEPWRVRLLGGDDEYPVSRTVEILLSGSDGSVGFFGHIAAGGDSLVYNVYPRGSERGAPGPVPIAEYLFDAQRGQALRRPTWVLRLEGLPETIVRAFHEDIASEVEDLQSGRSQYHPTANNCTIVSLKALGHLGFRVAKARYFTRRFPRPAFEKILSDLPHLIASGKLRARGVELIYIPQVPIRPSLGGAPNRPLRDRSRN